MALPSFRVCKTMHGGPPQVEHFTVKAGETFEAGQCVKIAATEGTLEEAVDTQQVLGVALGDAATHLADSTDCPVAMFGRGTIFSANNTGAPYAAATHLYNKYDLEVDGSGVHGVDLGTAGANAVFKVLGVDTTDTGSERVLVSTIAADVEGDDANPI